MSAAGMRRVRNGEVAALCACALISRADPGGPRHSLMMDHAERLSRALPQSGALITGARFSELIFALADHRTALETMVRLPTGERDWRAVYDTQAGLRQAVDRCLERLFERCLAVHSGAGSAAPRPAAAEAGRAV